MEVAFKDSKATLKRRRKLYLIALKEFFKNTFFKSFYCDSFRLNFFSNQLSLLLDIYYETNRNSK